MQPNQISQLQLLLASLQVMLAQSSIPAVSTQIAHIKSGFTFQSQFTMPTFLSPTIPHFAISGATTLHRQSRDQSYHSNYG